MRCGGCICRSIGKQAFSAAYRRFPFVTGVLESAQFKRGKSSFELGCLFGSRYMRILKRVCDTACGMASVKKERGAPFMGAPLFFDAGLFEAAHSPRKILWVCPFRGAFRVPPPHGRGNTDDIPAVWTIPLKARPSFLQILSNRVIIKKPPVGKGGL